jgi:hypothetical protein
MEGFHVKRRALLVGAALGGLGLDARAAVPGSIPLFVIARSKNANVVHCEARVARSRALERVHPLAAYWVMCAEDGRREDLTWLEERFAYGWSASFEPRGELLVRPRAFAQREIAPELGGVRGVNRVETGVVEG